MIFTSTARFMCFALNANTSPSGGCAQKILLSVSEEACTRYAVTVRVCVHVCVYVRYNTERPT
jgi:hypothetical protein